MHVVVVVVVVLQVFNRVAYVAIRVIKVKGYGRLQFTTQPCTHWSFAFYEASHVIIHVM